MCPHCFHRTGQISLTTNFLFLSTLSIFVSYALRPLLLFYTAFFFLSDENSSLASPEPKRPSFFSRHLFLVVLRGWNKRAFIFFLANSLFLFFLLYFSPFSVRSGKIGRSFVFKRILQPTFLPCRSFFFTENPFFLAYNLFPKSRLDSRVANRRHRVFFFEIFFFPFCSFLSDLFPTDIVFPLFFLFCFFPIWFAVPLDWLAGGVLKGPMMFCDSFLCQAWFPFSFLPIFFFFTDCFPPDPVPPLIFFPINYRP